MILRCVFFKAASFPPGVMKSSTAQTPSGERWDGFARRNRLDGKDGNTNASMNSFSHYSFGAVMEWAYRNLAGLDTEGSAGYQRIDCYPPRFSACSDTAFITPIEWVKAEYLSAHGRIATAWKSVADRFELDVTIPANTTATVFIPAKSASGITESGAPLNQCGWRGFFAWTRIAPLSPWNPANIILSPTLPAPDQRRRSYLARLLLFCDKMISSLLAIDHRP